MAFVRGDCRNCGTTRCDPTRSGGPRELRRLRPDIGEACDDCRRWAGEGCRHEWQTTNERVSCAEYEKRIGELLTAHGKRLAEASLALGINTDDVPTWETAHERIMGAIATLQAKAAQYDRMAAGEDLVGKAAKWDAYERKNTIKVATVYGEMTIKPDPTLRKDEFRLAPAFNPSDLVPTLNAPIAWRAFQVRCDHCRGQFLYSTEEQRPPTQVLCTLCRVPTFTTDCGVARPVERKSETVAGSSPAATAKPPMSIAEKADRAQRLLEQGAIKTPEAYLGEMKKPADGHINENGNLVFRIAPPEPEFVEHTFKIDVKYKGTLKPHINSAVAPGQAYIVGGKASVHDAHDHARYVDLMLNGGKPAGPGLAARYPDATKPDKLRDEPITCDLSGDWD